jgi:hypothetical protein
MVRSLFAGASLCLLLIGWGHISFAGQAREGQIGTKRNDLSDGLRPLLALTKHEDPVVRERTMTALSAAPEVRESPSTKRSAALALFGGLEDPEPSVRIAALLSLVDLEAWDYDASHSERIARVTPELAAFVEARGNDSSLSRTLGTVYLLNGEMNAAARTLEHSLAQDPGGPRTLYLLGLARLGQRRRVDAGALFRLVPPSDPYYANAQEQLKQIDPATDKP